MGLLWGCCVLRESPAVPAYEAEIGGYPETTGVGVRVAVALDRGVEDVWVEVTLCVVEGGLPCRGTNSKRPVPTATMKRSAREIARNTPRFLERGAGGCCCRDSGAIVIIRSSSCSEAVSGRGVSIDCGRGVCASSPSVIFNDCGGGGCACCFGAGLVNSCQNSSTVAKRSSMLMLIARSITIETVHGTSGATRFVGVRGSILLLPVTRVIASLGTVPVNRV